MKQLLARDMSTGSDKELTSRIRIPARSLVFQQVVCHDVDPVRSICCTNVTNICIFVIFNDSICYKIKLDYNDGYIYI